MKDSYNCDALAIAGATAAIADQQWFDQTRTAILATRDRLFAGLTELGFECTPSQANFVWCRHPEHESKALYEQLKANGVLVRYMTYPDWQDGLRVTVATDEQIDAFLAILGGLIG